MEIPISQGLSGAMILARLAAPAAARNVPAGRQQLVAATKLPSAAIDDMTGPRPWSTGRFLHRRLRSGVQQRLRFLENSFCRRSAAVTGII